nr:MAG TPA: portal [Caudoviricetes sp.]
MSLLGPNGQPMDQYMSAHAGRPKNPKPVVGDAFADWGGLSRDFIHLPGGGAIGFDTSKLRIKDFRKMREHYQIGSSLHVLTFMLHQLDWHVECDDKKVADWCTINLEQIWTRLIRAMSTAFAFGFSANAVEWENDPNEGKLRLNKIKDLVPEECEVSWKYVDSALKSNSDTGQMQAPKIPIFDGISRRGTSYKVPVENCVTPETPVLMYDYSWKKAGDVQVDDELLAFDEHQPASGYRRFRKSVVEVTGPVVRPTLTIETRTGQPITVSDDHKFLVRRDAQGATFGRVESDGKTCPNCGLALVKVHGNQKYCDEECQVEFLKNRRRKAGVGYKGSWAWVDAKDLKVGDKIGYFGDVSEYSETRAAGYVAGIFDGEGHLVFNGDGNSATLAFSQRSTAVLEDTLTYLDAFGFEYNVHSNNRDDCNEIVIAGGRREIARFMNVFDPVRLKSKSIGMFDGVAVKVGHSVDTATVSGIYDSGEQVVSKIQTSTRTLITEGYLSHNSLWYPLLMENGDYKGRQLLRTAFQPWFFSTLIHLYQNKYFERFGEPVPIGRAPYNDKVTMNDKTVYGYDLMATILSNLRSRSAVVLPNTRSKEGLNDQPEFDYQVEYLESQMRGADFERYLTRLDEEMSLALFTPLLLLRTADAGGFNQGIAHTQVYLWMLNAVAGDIAEYIDKYILRYMAIYNFGPKAKTPRIRFRKLGVAQQETLRAIVQSLIQKGMVKPNIEELGQHIGLDLEEIEQVTEPEAEPKDPFNDPEDDPEAGDDNGNKDGRIGRPERLKDGDGPKPGSTTKAISGRIAEQIRRAYRMDKLDEWMPAPGFRRQLVAELQQNGHADARGAATRFDAHVIGALTDVARGEVFDSADDFVKYAEGMIEAEGNRLYGAA